MAGKKENIPKMWELLKKEGIDLGPPVTLHENVYLGCGQRPLEPDLAMIALKRCLSVSVTLVLMANLLHPQVGTP